MVGRIIEVARLCTDLAEKQSSRVMKARGNELSKFIPHGVWGVPVLRERIASGVPGAVFIRIGEIVSYKFVDEQRPADEKLRKGRIILIEYRLYTISGNERYRMTAQICGRQRFGYSQLGSSYRCVWFTRSNYSVEDFEEVHLQKEWPRDGAADPTHAVFAYSIVCLLPAELHPLGMQERGRTYGPCERQFTGTRDKKRL